MKHVRFFNEFLREEVNLNKTRFDRLTQSVDAVGQFLSNLESYEGIQPQGSYALGTIIKPVRKGQEFDADLSLQMRYQARKQPKDYINDLYEYFKTNGTYKDKVRRKTRCIYLDYKGDFHLDIVPSLKSANTIYICNYETNSFEETDGTGYRDWFNTQNKQTNGMLKKVTRILKYLRDHKRNFTAKSILLTTLIGRAAEETNGKGFESLPEALKTVVNHINDFLQANSKMPRIANPAFPSEDFNRHWDQAKYDNFRKKFNDLTVNINEAYNAKEHNNSVEKWRSIFGDKFGTFKNNHHSATTTTPIAVTARKPYAR